MVKAFLADNLGVGIRHPTFERNPACPAQLEPAIWSGYVRQRKGGLAPFYARKTARHIIRVFKFQCYIIKEYTGYSKKALANEVAVLQQLHHGSLVSFLFFADEGARFSIVMEWAGQGLRGLVQQHAQPQAQHMQEMQAQQTTQQQGQPLAEEIARHITYQLANSLLYLQHKGIVHRDVKPDNIGVMPDFTVKLFDFGEALLLDQLAHLTDKQLAKVAGIAGTPLFMPPEMLLYLTQGGSSGSNGPRQCSGSNGSDDGWQQSAGDDQQGRPEGVTCSCWGRLGASRHEQQRQQQQRRQGPPSLRELASHKLDVWGLGTVLYFLLAGRDVLQQDCGYELADMAEVVNASSGIRLPSQVQVSKAAGDFLSRCLERNPRRRATAKELLQHPWLAGAGAGTAAAAVAALTQHLVVPKDQHKPQVALDTDLDLPSWPRGVDAIAAHRGLLHPAASSSTSSSSAPNTPLSGVTGAASEASGF